MTFISSSSILLSTLLLSVQKKNFSYCFASPRKWKKKKERNGGRWLWSSISNTWFNHKCAPKVKRASFAFEQIILSLKAFRHCQMNDSWYRILLLLSLAHKLSQREELIEGKKDQKQYVYIHSRFKSLNHLPATFSSSYFFFYLSLQWHCLSSLRCIPQFVKVIILVGRLWNMRF